MSRFLWEFLCIFGTINIVKFSTCCVKRWWYIGPGTKMSKRGKCCECQFVRTIAFDTFYDFIYLFLHIHSFFAIRFSSRESLVLGKFFSVFNRCDAYMCSWWDFFFVVYSFSMHLACACCLHPKQEIHFLAVCFSFAFLMRPNYS